MLKLGCHLSAAKGYAAMAEEARSIGANTFQFFTRNPRGGSVKAVDEADIARFQELRKEYGIEIILAHAPYTINPCAERPATLEFARNTMADDLQRLELVPECLYNFHPGCHVGQGVEKGVALVAETLNLTLRPELHTTVLLETMAGKGSEVGSRFEELRDIIDRTTLSNKLGVCLDTCHVFDGGYDIVNDLDGVLTDFDRTVGLSRLKAVHLNDSKNPFASHKDRHEVIGGGSLGLEAFRGIINHPALRDLPFFLETPNDLSGYQKEIALLKSLYKA